MGNRIIAVLLFHLQCVQILYAMLNLILIDYYKRNGSGLATYVKQLTDYLLKDKEIRLHFLLVAATGNKSIEKETHNDSVTYLVPHDIALRNKHDPDFGLLDYLAQELEGKEGIIFHFNWINHAPFAYLLKKRINCETVLTKHCIPWRDFITGSYPLFRHLEEKLTSEEHYPYLDKSLMREQIAYNAMDHIICVTQFAQRALEKLFQYPKEKMSVIRNGLHHDSTPYQDKAGLKAKYGFHPADPIILFAGGVNQRKGVFDLVQAFDKVLARMKNVRLVIAGTGDHGGVFKSTARNWSKITSTGVLDKQTLYDFYRMAEVGVVPSYVEQCSYTTIEMMHHGLPLIVTDVDGLAELVPDDCGTKIPLVLGQSNASIQTDELADQIVYLLEHQGIASQKASLAEQYALTHFNAEKMVAETVSVYKRLASSQNFPKARSSVFTQHPQVSVLLPCYNGEKYLKDCIDSVLRQIYPAFELIIINDGSTDKVAEIIGSYQDSRIKPITNERNLGITDSLNKGIQYATGKYIARIDTDDLMHEDRLHKQVQFLEKKGNEDIALVGSHHYVINQLGKMIGLKQYPVSHDEINNVMLFHNPFSHPSVMMRTDVAKKIKYSRKHPHAEDYHLWFKILKKHKAGNIPEYLTYYRVHDNNVSARNSNEQRESVADLLSSELNKSGINHSIEELTVHIAICQGYGTKFFNTEEKVGMLSNWIDKVLLSRQRKFGYPSIFIKRMKEHIAQQYCSVF